MRLRIALAAALAAAFLWPAAPAVPADGPFTVEKVVLFPKTGTRGLKIKVGPVVLEELVVRNVPDAGDLEKGKTDPGEKWRPRLSVNWSNTGDTKMKVFFTVKLEDKDGQVYFTCETDDTISGGATGDHSSLCMMKSMRMSDFPKVTHVRFILKVQPD